MFVFVQIANLVFHLTTLEIVAYSSYMGYNSRVERALFLTHTMPKNRSRCKVQYQKQTHKIDVSVTPEYVPSESDPEEGRYVWAYHVKLKNVGNKTVQLLNRFWKIIDGNGAAQEVRGPGVVGHQPILMEGESFEYASGTFLSTDSGVMMGKYEMVDEDENTFLVDIPMFSLDSEERKTRAH